LRFLSKCVPTKTIFYSLSGSTIFRLSLFSIRLGIKIMFWPCRRGLHSGIVSACGVMGREIEPPWYRVVAFYLEKRKEKKLLVPKMKKKCFEYLLHLYVCCAGMVFASKKMQRKRFHIFCKFFASFLQVFCKFFASFLQVFASVLRVKKENGKENGSTFFASFFRVSFAN
jgi:hypothetical protein